MKRELLIGCGSCRKKQLQAQEGQEEWSNLTTLDRNIHCDPDVLADLECLPLPFDDDYFDEIHAYEVLEHTGNQGDWEFFFEQWSDFWRILKPGGYFMGTCPAWNSPWAWGDPSHKRIVSRESLTFLSQKEYRRQVGKTQMSDFRFCYRADFDFHMGLVNAQKYHFILQAVKPSGYDIGSAGPLCGSVD